MTKMHIDSNGRLTKCTAFLRPCPNKGPHFRNYRDATEYLTKVEEQNRIAWEQSEIERKSLYLKNSQRPPVNVNGECINLKDSEKITKVEAQRLIDDFRNNGIDLANIPQSDLPKTFVFSNGARYSLVRYQDSVTGNVYKGLQFKNDNLPVFVVDGGRPFHVAELENGMPKFW